MDRLWVVTSGKPGTVNFIIEFISPTKMSAVEQFERLITRYPNIESLEVTQYIRFDVHLEKVDAARASKP